MAKVKIQGNASGTGVFTITPPATSTDRTLTLPDSAGTILDSTSTLDATKLSGNLPAISGASLTSLTSGNLTGALPAISGASLTNLPAAGETAKAWLSYKATTAVIFDSFNVSSVTDNAGGHQTMNFTTALANADYSAVASGTLQTGISTYNLLTCGVPQRATNNCQVISAPERVTALEDAYNLYINIFGDS